MDKASVIRTGLLLLAMINQALALFGKSPLPFDDVDFTNFVSFIFMAVTAAIAWWKNNYISDRGQAQKEVLKKNGLYKP